MDVNPAQQTTKVLDWAFVVIGMSMVLYHMISSQHLFFGSYEHQTIHLAFLLTLTFLQTMRKYAKPWVWAVQTVLIVLGLIATGYVFFNMSHLEEVIGYPTALDLVIGIVLMVLVLEGTRQAWGVVLPIVALIFIGYFYLGHYLPSGLWHRPFSFRYVTSYLSIGLSGIFGQFLSISANQVFLFVVFGSLMEIIKINDFFHEAGKVAGRFLEGGPAQTAVVSSGLVGMVTGAAVANVAIVGSVTIPFMKSVGYKPETAAAIEAAASTGGQLMPPVMGAAAFLMASFLGVPYSDVMLAGLLPAIFFYFAVALGVQLIATKNNIIPPKEPPNKRIIYRRLPLFAIPMGIMVVSLLLRYSPMVAGFWAIIAAIALSCISKETRPQPLALARSLAKGALGGAQIGVSLALVGMMAQVIITTAVGNKIAGIVEAISQGSLVTALFATMFVSLLLGCGIPTAAAYSLVAIVVVPIIVKMGVLPIAAHFFAFYFAIISTLTPPVALASLAAAGMAQANYFKTSVQAFTLAISGFLIPFLIIYNPTLIFRPEDWMDATGTLIAMPAALIALTAFIYGFGLVRLSVAERVLCLLITASLMAYLVAVPMKSLFLLGGLVSMVFMLINQRTKKRALGALEQSAGAPPVVELAN